MPLHVEVVSPERILFSGEADMVVCRTIGGGEVAFLTGHAPFLGALEISRVKVKGTSEAGDLVAAVHGGFVHVRDDKVIVLSDVAELADQIDVARAQHARDAAGDDAAARRRAEVRLDVAGASGGAAAH